MDISRCLVALGQEFQFPIDFSADKHLKLTSTPASVTSYSHDLATPLSALREVATLLVDEQRAYHREFINAQQPDPKIYSVGNTVFACRATQSDAGCGQVDKLIYPFTGPWLMTAKFDGASYEIEHVATKWKDKKHTLDFSPYPAELIAIQPLDSADNQFGQIHRKICNHPYKEAGIKGFTPPTPFQVPTNFITTSDTLTLRWPTLAELNNKQCPYPWSHNEEFNRYLSEDADSLNIIPGFYTGPPPSAPLCAAPTIPPAAVLAQQIIKSTNKLFFISNSIGASDVREWRSVRVALEATMAVYFYTSHPSDYWYNVINQRSWLQYHSQDDILANLTSANTHLLCSTDSSDTYTARHKLLPLRKYINLTHMDTFIHDLFDFSTINKQKSQDRISQIEWDILKSHCHLYHNPLLRFDVPTYSVHVDADTHTIFFCAALASALSPSAQREPLTPPS
jgi:hypothetical protein